MTADWAVGSTRLLEAVGKAVIVTDTEGVIQIWNGGATELYGWLPHEVAGRSVLEVLPAPQCTTDAEIVFMQVRSAKPWAGDMEMRRRDGETFLAAVTATPVLDDHGAVIGIIGVSEDVTEWRKAAADRERLLAAEAAARAEAETARAEAEAARSEAEAARVRVQYLADAMSSMTESLDVRTRLKALTETIVPWLADGCGLYLLDGDGQPVLEVLHHTDPGVVAAVRSLDARFPANLDAPVGTGAAISQRRTSWLPEITPELISLATGDEGQLEELKDLHPRSGVAIPLIGRNVVVGAATIFTTGDRILSAYDVSLAEDLCARAGIALENAQLIEARAEDGRKLRFQSSLLRAQNEAGVEGNLIVDPDGRVLSYNRRFLEVWGFDPSLVDAANDDLLLEEATTKVADPDAFIKRERALYESRPDLAHDEIVLADGRTLDRHGAPLRGPDGEYYGWAWYVRDISAERERQAQILAMGRKFAALARTLQRSLLPPALPELAGIDLAARYHPALQGLEVGGDFYDVFPTRSHWMLVVGDVCGKGAAAAALTALARYTVRAAATHDDDPASVLAELNAAMLADNPEDLDGRFATVCCVRLTTGNDDVTATIACGGHPPPFVARADGGVETVGTYGTVLGILPVVDITSTSTVLRAGDSLVALTDGVLEARDAEGAQLDEVGVMELLGTEPQPSASATAELLEQRAIARQGGVARDDIAIVLARVRPSGS